MNNINNFIPQMQDNLKWIKDFVSQVDTNSMFYQELAEDRRNFLACLRRIEIYNRKNINNQEVISDINKQCLDVIESHKALQERYNKLFGNK